MLRFFFIFISLVLFELSYAQELNKTDSSNNKNTSIVQDVRLVELSETYRSSFKLMGYRIQIFSGNKKQPARDARLAFVQIFNTIKAHEIYEQPYFKVRVGDFKTKIEALKFKNELIKHFPNCFIVRDEIDFKEGIN
ncbi:MAG: hypothetical protein COX70_00610 [Flavobacteriales bacterium CG_4_10_14_0_2_um_filter_32_8]|nr:MAG: hypothetical protein COX70_00610 [Flavobacteriales bacterium CG_4_10_14_0_2_um_filter_32_8]PJB16360.1 MAG: hypothetical protein CO118_00640 [Flavobacteriales bacterium CG_4_9_14_3_um_filter_32_8]